MIVLAATAVIIGYYVMRKRKHRVFHEYNHHDRILCVVTFYDRGHTLPLMEAYFEQEFIRVNDVKREIKRDGEQELFIHAYELKMPQRAQQGALVGYLSSIKTVQSVQIKPL